MKTNQKDNACTGGSLFKGVENMGGHVEDYIGDPNNPAYYPKSLQWVAVSKSFS